MGPKKKAPKKTKEELEEERRLQEEAEARARAEEEKQLEEERHKRELEAAQRREEAARRRAAELERLALKADAAQPDLDGKASRLADILRARKEANDWERYVACEPRPNAEVEGDLNSFVNAWLLDAASAVDEPQPLAAVVSAAAAAASVLDDLSFAVAGARAANDARLVAQCARFTAQLRALAIEQVELATARVLQFADEYADAGLGGSSSSLSGANAANRGEVRLSSAQGGVALGLWVNLLAKSGRGKKVDFGEAVGVAVDLPKAVLLQSLALRALHWPFDHLSSAAMQHGGGGMVALGGVFAVELLAIPAPPKRARGWVMRELPDSASGGDPQQHTKRLHYPLEGTVASAALPIKVSLSLPAQISLAVAALASSGALRVGWWDAASASWQEDGVSDVSLSPESNSVAFSTLRLAPLAVLQRRDLHFHKRAWHLAMDTAAGSADSSADLGGSSGGGGNRALLTLSTESLDAIQFLVTDAGCALLSPSVPHLVPPASSGGAAGLLEPGELLVRLAACGIDLCPPAVESADAVEDGGKLKALEDRVIDEVVRVVAAYEVRLADLSQLAPPPESALSDQGGGPEEYGPDYSSMARWLAAVDDPRKLVLSVREVLWPYIDAADGDDAVVSAGDAEAMRASPVTVLAEMDAEAAGGGVVFRLDRSCRADAYDSHVHLAAALDGFSSPDARDRMAASNVLFESTLKKLLRLLRLFSSSTPSVATSSAASSSASAVASTLAVADASAVEFDGATAGIDSSINESISGGNESTEGATTESEPSYKEAVPESTANTGDVGVDPANEATSAAEPVA